MRALAESQRIADRIAILFGIPVDREEFIWRVGQSDWLSKFNESGVDPKLRQQGLDLRWNQEYFPLVAEPLQKLIAFATALGTDVRTNATLTVLREVTAKSEIVILFAHWKGSEVTNDDFVVPFEKAAFLERARRCDTLLGKWIFSRLQSLEPVDGNRSGIFHKTLHRAKELLNRGTQSPRDILNDALRISLPDTPIDAGAVLEHEITRSARRRDEIDAMFVGLLRPGNLLELFDGLHRKEVVESAIALGVTGILDLTTCTSTVLADYIAARRHHEIRTVQFPTVQEFLWCAKCVEATLQLVVGNAMPYQEARRLAGNAITHILKGLMKQR